MTEATIKPVLTWRSAICDSDLPATARHVALTLSIYMNERGGSAFPGGGRLAADTGLSLRTVRTALSTLEEAGWLRVVTRGGSLPGRERKATVYEAAVPMTGATPALVEETPAPVQEFHRCNSRHRPVQLTTPTGAGVAPQVSKKLPENSLAPADADAGVESLRSAILEAAQLDPTQITRSAGAAIGKALRDLVGVGATTEQVPIAAEAFRRRFPTATLTPLALAKHWPALTGSPTPVPALSDAARFGLSLARWATEDDASDEIADRYPSDPTSVSEAWNAYRAGLETTG